MSYQNFQRHAAQTGAVVPADADEPWAERAETLLHEPPSTITWLSSLGDLLRRSSSSGSSDPRCFGVPYAACTHVMCFSDTKLRLPRRKARCVALGWRCGGPVARAVQTASRHTQMLELKLGNYSCRSRTTHACRYASTHAGSGVGSSKQSSVGSRRSDACEHC